MCVRNIPVYFLHINKVVIHLPLLLLCEESKLSEAVAQKGKQTKQILVTKLDLTKIDGNGDFLCPTCGVTISPEDETEDVYTIIKEKVRNDALEELVIQCNACSSRICLTGFPSLEMNASEVE